jgi:hypothetical protein
MNRNTFKIVSIYFTITIILSILVFTSCRNPKPIPKNKETFIGIWMSHSGFKIEIKSAGTATLTQITDTIEPDYNKLNIKVAGPTITDMLVEFVGDSVLSLVKPLIFGKEYIIDKNPYQDRDTSKLVLNGVLFIKQK